VRNPRARRTAALAWAASEIAAGAAAFLLPGPSAPDWVRAGLSMYGLTAVVLGLATASATSA
jgi:alanine racemase